MCPTCQKPTKVIKRGSYLRPSDRKKVQRFQCKNCLKSFSAQTASFDYRLRKRRINQRVFLMLSKGMSQRGCAEVLGVDPKTISRRVWRFGRCAKNHLRKLQKSNLNIESVTFDEMETFEHTKLKPLTIPLAVDTKTRKILALGVGKIAAKGHLASLGRSKYGYRKCERKKTLSKMFEQLGELTSKNCLFLSDESQHYPNILKSYFKSSEHRRYKGRKPAVVGQGEMKKGGFDPLFSLNQTAAMFRDNIKRLGRRTWCTTKRIDRLLDFLHMYAFYHNQIIDGIRRPRMRNCSGSI